jgi:hypothetical protein
MPRARNPEPEHNPLDTVIRSRASFVATVDNAAAERGLDTSQLFVELQRALKPGTAHITVGDIIRCADRLRDSGLAIPRFPDAAQHILDRELAEHAAATPHCRWNRGRGAEKRGPAGGHGRALGTPKKRATRSHARPASRHSLGR